MPTQAGYLDFLRNVVGIAAEALPNDSPYVSMTYGASVELVLHLLQRMPSTYTIAVYNLATHFLVSQCPDQEGQTIFNDLRVKFGLMNFTPGLIQASNDETTGQSWMIPDIFKKSNLRELDLMKTPWGRTYMEIAQIGFPMWGIS